MKRSLEHLRKDINYLTGYMEDTKLSEEEIKQLQKSIKKVKAGDTSSFVSWEKAKKELEV